MMASSWPTGALLPSLDEVDPAHLRSLVHQRLDRARTWKTEVADRDVRVASGRVLGHARRVWWSAVTIDASLDAVARWMADDMIERLPEWSAEFVDGEVLQECAPGDAVFRRVMRARYRTPAPLADREYVYWLERFDTVDEVLVTYQSIRTDRPPSPGAVYASLCGTAHRIRPVADGCALEHVLVTDLGGHLPGWVVDHLFRAGMRAAHRRDGLALADRVR